MKKQKETVIKVLKPYHFRGGWAIRFIHQDTIRYLCEAPYVEKSFPMQISCTSFMESATIKSKYQKIVFKNIEICNGKLYFEKLHMCVRAEYSPSEFYNVTKNSFEYEGFWGIPGIHTFEFSLSQKFDMREMFQKLKIITSQLNRVFRSKKEITSNKILEYLLDVLNISLQDIEFLVLGDLLKIKSGNIICTSK